MSKYRELYKQAEQAKSHENAYKTNPVGIVRPNYDRVLKAFFPVIDNQYPVFFRSADLRSMHRVFALQKDLNFSIGFDRCKARMVFGG